MMQKRVNNGRFNASQLFAVLFAIFLIFSSCSTKRGIKSLLDLPVSTTKTVLHLENDKLVSNNSNCLSCKDLQVLTVDNSETSLRSEERRVGKGGIRRRRAEQPREVERG